MVADRQMLATNQSVSSSIYDLVVHRTNDTRCAISNKSALRFCLRRSRRNLHRHMMLSPASVFCQPNHLRVAFLSLRGFTGGYICTSA